MVFMRALPIERRFFAQPLVKDTIVEQGRVAAWIARQIGITKFQMSHVLAGRRPLSEEQARLVAVVLAKPMDTLFRCSDEHESSAA